MDFIDYRVKLGLAFEDRDLERMFFNRIFNALDELDDMNLQRSLGCQAQERNYK